jgi:hypothetical protein
MNYLKVFIKGVLQTIFYYMILICIGVFNIPFMIFFYLKNVFKAEESNEYVNESTRQGKTMESATEY